MLTISFNSVLHRGFDAMINWLRENTPLEAPGTFATPKAPGKQG
ncbi:hypothetical protein [Roseovarius sp. MMSF_3281]|nr:hypothetical protein [Roseovarius sp. MMSF_3281]